MTILFTNLRLVGFVAVFLLSGAVLGLAANFAHIFLPNINHDFTIFSLVVPSLTIFLFLLLLQWAQPRMEIVAHFILGVLWLAMGAWSADIIGPIQCYPLANQTTPTNSGTMSLQTYCYEMKVIEALSWMLFVVFAFFFIMIIALTTRAIVFGRFYAWREHISQLGWFNELPGYPREMGYPRPPFWGRGGGAYPGYGYGGYGAYPMGGYTVQQHPGQQIIIQPNPNGPPMITQIPVGM